MWTRYSRRRTNPPPVDEWTMRALRSALQRMESPAASPGFDERVLAAVRGRSPWNELVLWHARPALATAVASAVATLCLMNFPGRAGNPALAATRPRPAVQRQAEKSLRRLLQSESPSYLAYAALRRAAVDGHR